MLTGKRGMIKTNEQKENIRKELKQSKGMIKTKQKHKKVVENKIMIERKMIKEERVIKQTTKVRDIVREKTGVGQVRRGGCQTKSLSSLTQRLSVPCLSQPGS